MTIHPDKMEMLLSEIATAYEKARAKHAPMKSPHEGYAIILEELDELWDEVKAWQPKPQDGERMIYDENMRLMRKEALHVAAMAMAFLVEVCE